MIFVLLFVSAISFAQPGMPDTTFGQNGFVVKAPIPLGHAQINASVVRSDGKILLAGFGWNTHNRTASLIRLNADGSPDYSFGLGGLLLLELPGVSEFTSIVLQPDGKILCAGKIDFDSDTEFDIFLVRMKENGSFDSTFGVYGMMSAITDAFDEDISAIALQDDGKIVIAGSTDQSGTRDFLLLRFTSDGEFDESFSGDGVVITGAANEEEAFSLAIQTDGKIIAAGYTSQLGSDDFALVRYNTDGSLDATFSDDGIVATGGGWSDKVKAVLLQDDGKIVAAGSSYDGVSDVSIFSLARYTPLGNLDPDFGSSGIQTSLIGASCQIMSACLQDDQKIIVAGASDDGGDPCLTLARYTTAGILDTDFGTAGIAIAPFGGEASFSYTVLVRNNGNILASGMCFIPPVPFQMNAMACFLNDGTLDTDFDGDGMAQMGAGNSLCTPLKVLLQNNGKILTVGIVNNEIDDDAFIMINNPDGSFDDTFDDDGLLIVDGSFDEEFRSAAIKYSGGTAENIYVVGEQSSGGHSHMAVVCYTMDGTMDPAFAGGSPLMISVGTNDNASDITIMDDGSIIISGYTDDGSNSDFLLVSVSEDGTINTGFDDDGIVTTDITPMDILSDMEIQADGKIVLAGFSDDGNDNFTISRYNADGSLDQDFGNDGIVVIENSDEERLMDIAIHSDGKIVAAGSSDNGSENNFLVLQLNTDGTLDQEFGSEGILLQNIGLPSLTQGAQAVQIQENGKMLVTGNIDSGSGKPEMVTMRLYPDGSVDETYGIDGFIHTTFEDAAVVAITTDICEDDKLIIAGLLMKSMENRAIALFRFNAGDPVIPESSITNEISQGMLEQNMPNPFRHETVIKFSMDQPAWVSLKVYDISGNEIATLMNDNKTAGSYEVSFESSGLNSGVYYYRLIAGNHSETRKMLLLR